MYFPDIVAYFKEGDDRPLLTWDTVWDTEHFEYIDKVGHEQDRALVFFTAEDWNTSSCTADLLCALAVALGRMEHEQGKRFTVVLVPEKDREMAMNYLSHGDVLVLWDKMGEFDDIAVMKSEEIDIRCFGDEESGLFCQIIASFRNTKIIGDRARKIAELVKVGLFEKLHGWAVDPNGRDYMLCRPSADCLQELVDALTFGNRSVDFETSFAGYDDYKTAPSSKYYEEVAVELVLGGYVSAPSEIVAMAALYRELDDILDIWEKTLARCGVPFKIVVNEDVKDFEEYPETSKKTNVRSEGIQAVGAALGIDSAIEAYFSGVPVEDLLA